MSIEKSLQLILFAGTFAFIEMFPTGAPAARCSDMFPNHQAAAQTGSAPYEVVVDNNSFGNGSTVTVTLNSTTGLPFRGFMIQMRQSVNTPETVVPGFTLPVTGSSGNLLTCQGRTGAAVTHRENGDKTMISFQWTPPIETTGNVRAVATVVHNVTTFWTMVLSENIEGPPGSNSSPTVHVTTTFLPLLFVVLSRLLKCVV